MPFMIVAQTAQTGWQPPGWVGIVAIGITWATFVFAFLRLRWDHQKVIMDMEKAKKDRDRELEDMALRVCREFASSREYKMDRDQRVREIANEQVDEAFRQRSSSFVSADKFDERTRALESKIDQHNTILQQNTEKIGNMSGQITQAVTTQLTAFLATRVFGKE